MIFSYSNVESFEMCPYKWMLRYKEGLKTIPNWDDSSNPLLLGTALHHGCQFGVEEAVKEYFKSYPIISDGHLDEVEKMKILIPKVQALINPKAEFEVKLETSKFLGFIDYWDEETKTILDFKYTSDKNFQTKYIKSPQIHVYKYYFEKLFGKKVERLGYLQIPKIQPRQKKTENQLQFRQRLQDELMKLEPHIEYIEFSQKKVDGFLKEIENIENATEFPKNETGLCMWCEYQDYCSKGENYMLLPKNERRAIVGVTHKKMWLYGAPFSGKTTLADKFPEPLMINTDGNTEFCTSPVVEIKDIVEMDGRISNVVLAWEVFKSAVAELEKGSTFKTIVVDLTEDLYECCRLYIYKQMGITHESDDSFRAWDKVRTEFLSTMRKLTNLPYNIVLISHEDTSKDITKRSGDKITSIRPNINEKVANKLAGMVDIVVRVVVIDGEYRLTFKSDEVVFGGGRINPTKKEIPNDYDTLMNVVYGDKVISPVKKEEPVVTNPLVSEEKAEEKVETKEEPIETEEAPRKRRARRAPEAPISVEDTVEEPKDVAPQTEEEATEEVVVKRTRRSRRENN